MTIKFTFLQREARARRAARRLDLVVAKLRANDTYVLLDPKVLVLPAIFRGASYGLALDDLEQELRERGAYEVLIREPRQ